MRNRTEQSFHPSSFHELSSRFRNSLFPEARQFYESIPEGLRDQYERGLYRVQRGGFFIAQGFPNAKDFNETDLEHVVLGEERIKNSMETYPVLQKYINRADTQVAFGGHDSGETHLRINDVPPFGRTPREEIVKRLEPWAAHLVIAKIPNPRVREETLLLYDRYIENDPKDLEIQFARYTDRAQGTIDPARLVFKINGATREQRRKVTEHLWIMVARMVEPAINLITYLPTEEAREAVKEIVFTDLAELKKYGPMQVPETFEKGFSKSA